MRALAAVVLVVASTLSSGPPTFAEGQAVAAAVKPGWTKAQVIARAGEPTSKDGARWHWMYGHPDGPRLDLFVTLRDGRVVDVRHASAGCVLRE